MRPQGSYFGGQKAIRWGSNRIISAAGCKISAKRPLGALMDPCRTEKTKLETALGRPRGASRQVPVTKGQKAVRLSTGPAECAGLPGRVWEVCSRQSPGEDPARRQGTADSIASRIPPGLGPWIEGPWRRSLQRGYVTNMVATLHRNGFKIDPKWCQYGC